ncbi:hypothetical protein LCGC14_0441210 [marine sediment metagenome]|uniref:Uncharacterized protein n=1 Tax=marine sediment metagenome TaxID=412755 RepID=A0A0F9SR77_9ZZZZ
MSVSDEERSIIHHWRRITKRGQLILAKLDGRLDNCEVKVQHNRSSFMGSVDPGLDSGDTDD